MPTKPARASQDVRFEKGKLLLELPNSRWFPAEVIERLNIVQQCLKTESGIRALAAELDRCGFVPRRVTYDEPPGVGNAQEKWMASRYWHALLNAVWPEDLAAALWQPGRTYTRDDTDLLIRFLEANPFFFRSGYAKQRAISRLGHCPIMDSDRRRLEAIVRRTVMSGWGANLTDWRKLVKFCDADALRQIVRVGLVAPEQGVAKKAILLGLTAMNQGKLVRDLVSRNPKPPDWSGGRRLVEGWLE